MAFFFPLSWFVFVVKNHIVMLWRSFC